MPLALFLHLKPKKTLTYNCPSPPHHKNEESINSDKSIKQG